jgi:hypothetical protein
MATHYVARALGHGRIQKRKTHDLQTITFGLQRAAGQEETHAPRVALTVLQRFAFSPDR